MLIMRAALSAPDEIESLRTLLLRGNMPDEEGALA